MVVKYNAMHYTIELHEHIVAIVYPMQTSSASLLQLVYSAFLYNIIVCNVRLPHNELYYIHVCVCGGGPGAT